MKLQLAAVATLIAAPGLAQTPGVAIDATPVADRCEALPIGGTGSVTGGGATLTIAGGETRRVLTLAGRPVRRLGSDVASASIRAACHGTAADYYLLGLATSAAAPACALRYQVAEVAGRAVRLSPRFGSCADGATASLQGGQLIVSMPAGPGSPVNIAYRYAAGQMTAVAPAPVAVAQAEPLPRRRSGRAPVVLAAWTPPQACAVIARDTSLSNAPADADLLLAGFARDWPRDWRTRGRLSDQPFTHGSLRAVVTDLACLAALHGGKRIVARMARPLFESHRHGKQAFEELDGVARGAVVDPGVRAAARLFHAQMRYEVDKPRLE